MNPNDFLKEQIIAISKAGAYDAIAPKMAELQEENTVLRSENAQLKIRLKGALDMCHALKDAFNETKPEGAQMFELSGNTWDKDADDIKDVL
jgi:regulator of replication initiation timing